MKAKRKWRVEWAWLIAVLFVILLGFSWLPGRARDKLDSYSPTPRGKSAFYALVARYVRQTSRHERRLIPPGDKKRTLVILGPARYPKEAEWKRLHRWVSEGNTLVFAARLQDPLVELKGFGLRIVSASPHLSAAKRKIDDALTSGPADDDDEPKPKKKTGTGASHKERLPDAHLELMLKTKLVAGAVRWFSKGQIKTAPGVKVKMRRLITSNRGDQAVVAAVGSGRVVVVASDEIFANQSHLLGTDHPVLAYRLFEQRGADQPVVFDEYLNVTGTPKVFGLLFEAMLRPITLQLLLIAALFGWWGSRRFGPPAPPSIPPRRSIVEHAEALGNWHFRSGTGARAVAAYLELWRAEMHLGGAAARQKQQLAVIARRAGRDPDEVAQLVRRATAAAQQTEVTAAQAAHIIRELSGLRNQTKAHREGNPWK